MVCHVQSSKASPKHKTSHSEIQNLIWRCTLLTSLIQKHCQPHQIFETLRTENKPAPGSMSQPNHSQEITKTWWIAKPRQSPSKFSLMAEQKSLYMSVDFITNLFSHPEPPTWRLIGHLSYSPGDWFSIRLPPGKVWWQLSIHSHWQGGWATRSSTSSLEGSHQGHDISLVRINCK